MSIALTLTAIVAAAAAAGCVGLYVSRAALRRECEQVRADRDKLEAINLQHLEKLEAQQRELGDQRTQLEVAQQREKSLSEAYDQAQKQARETFESLAGKTLRQTVDDFRKQAEQLFKSEQEKAGEALKTQKVSIESMIKPVRESLSEYQKRLAEAEKERVTAYGSLKQQAEALAVDQQRLRAETANLVKALRRPEGRGRWGEMQMTRLFELAGMSEHVDFDEQAKVDSGEGPSLRPDFIIRLPNERVIVIDVKTPLDAYLNATEAADETERERYLEQHVRQLKQAAANLASKSYWEKCDGSPEFVVMFVPGESMLYAAASRDSSLIEAAMEKNVIIATPTVMMALLKTVAMGWREKSLAENAERIATLGRELHERLATVLGHVSKLGKRIHGTVQDYNRLLGSAETRLVPTARKFAELKADSPKELPGDMEPLVEMPRELRAVEAGDGDLRSADL